MEHKPETLAEVDKNYPHLTFVLAGTEFSIQLDNDEDEPNAFYLTDTANAALNQLVVDNIDQALKDAAFTARRNLKDEWKEFTTLQDL